MGRFNIGGAVLGGAMGFASGGGGVGAAAGALAGGYGGPDEYEPFSASDVRLGHAEDTRSFKERDIYSWNQAKARGLTPQEYYGSSASGGSSSSGGANVLGNSQDKQRQLQSQQAQEVNERQKDRLTSIAQTKMQTDTQKTVAEIQSGTTKRGQDISSTTQKYTSNLQNDIANKNYKLAKQKLEQIEKPKLQADLKISSQQFKKLSNDIATSTPKFTLYMKKLSMGVDNMMVEFLQHSYGVDITDPKSVQAMSPEQKTAFINHTAAINSHAFREAAGITLGVSGRAATIGSSTSNLLGNSYPVKKPSDYVHGSIHKQNTPRYKTLPKSKMRSQRY